MQTENNKEKYIQKVSGSKGYAILFVVLLVTIILSMTIGIANIALKESIFTATAKDSHVSFFAADSAGECAIYNFGPSGGAYGIHSFADPNNPLVGHISLNCNGTIISADQQMESAGVYSYNFKNDVGVLPVQDGCAYLKITLDYNTQHTTIAAYGYNVSCSTLTQGTSNALATARQVERVLTYELLFN